MSGPIYINKDGELERELLNGTPRKERLVWSSYSSDEAWWEDTANPDYEAAWKTGHRFAHLCGEAESDCSMKQISREIVNAALDITENAE